MANTILSCSEVMLKKTDDWK